MGRCNGMGLFEILVQPQSLVALPVDLATKLSFFPLLTPSSMKRNMEEEKIRYMDEKMKSLVRGRG